MSRRNRGFTIIELVISITMLTIIAIIVGGFVVRTLHDYKVADTQAADNYLVTALINRVGRVVRGATALIVAQDNTLTIQGYFDPVDVAPSQIRYFVSGGSLSVGVIPASGTAPNYTYPSANETVKVLATKVVNAQPAFSYYDDQGNALASGFSLVQVKQIGLYLSVNSNSRITATPAINQTRITLRNMKTNL